MLLRVLIAVTAIGVAVGVAVAVGLLLKIVFSGGDHGATGQQ